MFCCFGLFARIDHAPAGARPRIAPQPHERAAAGRAPPSPLGKGRGHDLARDHAAERQISLGIGIAQRRGIDTEQPLQVVIAHVLEVPAGAAIARHAGLPRRVMDHGLTRRERCFERRLVGDVGESQALGGEADLAPALFSTSCALTRS